MSYKIIKILGMLLLAAGYIQNVYNCTNINIVIKYMSYCNYSKTYKLFQN